MSSGYPRMTGNRGDDLADGVIYLMLRHFLIIITAIFQQFQSKKQSFVLNLSFLPISFKYQASIYKNFGASRKLLPSPPNLHNHYLIQTKSSQRQPGKRTDTLYLWPRSKGWMRARGANIQPAATKVTNMLYFSFRRRPLCLHKLLLINHCDFCQNSV